MHTILVVDDEKDILDSIERQFRKSYKILKASSGYDALKVLQTEPIHLILSDQRMPEMTGVQVFERAQKIQPDAIRILLTGYTDVESIIAAINSGHIYRYITKPWDPGDLEIVVRKALETYDLRAELKAKNTRLEKALSELQTLDQAKSQFMILIGHELKTPLTTISSFLDLLKEEKLSQESTKYISRIEQGVVRLKEIVFDVLDLLSAETGQLKINKVSQNLDDSVSRVIQTLSSQIEKKNIKVNREPVGNAVFDGPLVEKVLKKLLHNAVKFAPAGSGIWIESGHFNGKVRVQIRNSGPSMDPEKIASLKKPFTLDENIMNHSQGLGMGLSVSQSLLKHHGSDLVLDSKNSQIIASFDL